jgi:hypothetical protein
MDNKPEHKKSKRGRVGEGRPTKRTPEVMAKIAEAVAIGLTDEEAALLAGINPDTMTEWHKDAKFSGAIKRATAQRLLLRLERIEAGEQGWQGTAWALERIYPHRFARPEVMNQIAVVTQGGKAEYPLRERRPQSIHDNSRHSTRRPLPLPKRCPVL